MAVLTTGGHAETLLVRWPGGHETASALRAGALEVAVAVDGTLQVLR
jgi:hypothetical protein